MYESMDFMREELTHDLKLFYTWLIPSLGPSHYYNWCVINLMYKLITLLLTFNIPEQINLNLKTKTQT